MPVIRVPLPILPANLVYVKAIIPWQEGNVRRVIYSDHFFDASGPLSTFNAFNAAINDFLPQWFRHVFSPLRTSDMVNVGFQFFARVNTYTQSIPVSPTWPASTNGVSLGHQFKARVSRRAASGVDYFWGRFTFPPIPRLWCEGSYINATGLAAYASAQIVYMNPWTSQGLLFTPCGWSRKYNTVYPLDKLKIFPLVTHDRKSRPKDFLHSNIYIWPTVF